MPKKNTKKSTATRVKKTVRKDIEAAVERLPDMIAKEMFAIPKKQALEERMQEPPRLRTANRQNRVFLWIGVSTITAAVFVMWVVNTKAMFFDIKHTKSAEAIMLEEAKDDIEDILKSGPKKPATSILPVTEQKAPEAMEASVKEALSAIFAGAAASSTPSTTTKSEPTKTP